MEYFFDQDLSFLPRRAVFTQKTAVMMAHGCGQRRTTLLCDLSLNSNFITVASHECGDALIKQLVRVSNSVAKVVIAAIPA